MKPSFCRINREKVEAKLSICVTTANIRAQIRLYYSSTYPPVLPIDVESRRKPLAGSLGGNGTGKKRLIMPEFPLIGYMLAPQPLST